jgi:hypothetical protein
MFTFFLNFSSSLEAELLTTDAIAWEIKILFSPISIWGILLPFYSFHSIGYLPDFLKTSTNIGKL